MGDEESVWWDKMNNSWQRSSTTDQVTVHDTDQAIVQDGDYVQHFVSVIGQKEYSLAELMSLLGLFHRPTFQKNYLSPKCRGLVESTIPDKPKSPTQRYRLSL